MSKVRVTFMSYDWRKYSDAHEARAAGALHEFDKEMHDMGHVNLYAETLHAGMKLHAAVSGVEAPMLIVKMKL